MQRSAYGQARQCPGLWMGGRTIRWNLERRSSRKLREVTGIRFYKSASNTGTHTGSLWTSTGVLLATGTFSGETASGWQQMAFASPVAVSANTRYIVSYHTSVGHYSADLGYFSTSGMDAPPLHAPASGSAGGNGLFGYGAGSLFPSQTYNAANYWVDVVFLPGNQADIIPPAVSAITPAADSIGVAIGTTVTIAFSAPLDPATVNSNTIVLTDASNTVIPSTVTYDSTTQRALLTPASNLKIATGYTVAVKGGAGGVADPVGNTLASTFAASFTTVVSYGAKGGGPGGPILIVTDPSNPFSEYYAEILLAEGLNEFDSQPISKVSSTVLAKYDVVILGQIALSAGQVSMISDWVNAGGKLIAMRPDRQLAGLLGINATGPTLSEGYVLMNTGSSPGIGIVAQPIQFHGAADCYTILNANSLAVLYSNTQTATSNPAVTLRTVGTNGGQAAAFAFDLAKSIVQTRQGNPAWAGQERDGQPPIRSDDLFYGAASFDPQPNWVDLNKVAIPQADEHQRYLANLIVSMESARMLLPRFWYFPNGYRAAVVMTGDDHGNGGTVGRFSQYVALSSSNGSTANWSNIRATSYIYPSTVISNAQAAALDSAGFEIALHLNTDCADYTRSSLEQMFAIQLGQFDSTYPSLPLPVTHRVHCVAWSGYTTMAEVELLNGIRLDTSYYYWPASWVADKPGFFTGSAMPMRFATTGGDALDVYQAATQMTDESGQSFPNTIDSLLDLAVGPNGYYGAFVANMHTDKIASAGSEWIVSSAMRRGVPVISARQLLKWCDARTLSSILPLSWSQGILSFLVKGNAAAQGNEVMIPVLKGDKVNSVSFNGTTIPYTLRGVKGVQYAALPALSGSYRITYGRDITPPALVSIQPSNGGAGVYRNATVEVRFNEAMAPATLNTTSLTLRTPSNATVPASIAYNPFNFTVTLSASSLLAASTRYTVVVKGGVGGVSDNAGNVIGTDSNFTFTTGTATAPSFSLWASTATPGLASANDSTSLELGMQFMSAKSGNVTAIRFYKGTGNTGTHTGGLWTASGSLLGSVTFSGESSSGWQTQKLSTPVHIAANTPYVVSYHAPAGHYAADIGYFANSGVINYPLRALSDGENGGNGLYRSGKSRVFPNQTSGSSNYWVDVVFVPDL